MNISIMSCSDREIVRFGVKTLRPELFAICLNTDIMREVRRTCFHVSTTRENSLAFGGTMILNGIGSQLRNLLMTQVPGKGAAWQNAKDAQTLGRSRLVSLLKKTSLIAAGGAFVAAIGAVGLLGMASGGLFLAPLLLCAPLPAIFIFLALYRIHSLHSRHSQAKQTLSEKNDRLQEELEGRVPPKYARKDLDVFGGKEHGAPLLRGEGSGFPGSIPERPPEGAADQEVPWERGVKWTVNHETATAQWVDGNKHCFVIHLYADNRRFHVVRHIGKNTTDANVETSAQRIEIYYDYAGTQDNINAAYTIQTRNHDGAKKETSWP